MKPGFSDAKSAIVRVGDGRGFVIAHKRRIDRYVVCERYVVTAAHCLPRFLVFHGEPGWAGWDTTYQKLLAPLGAEPAVWAECVFADPVSDIAVFGKPDSQALGDQAEAYDELVEAVTPLEIASPGKDRLARQGRKASFPGWRLVPLHDSDVRTESHARRHGRGIRRWHVGIADRFTGGGGHWRGVSRRGRRGRPPNRAHRAGAISNRQPSRLALGQGAGIAIER